MFVYILHSESIGQYYVGITADMGDRLKRHNEGRSKATKKGIPRTLVKKLAMENISEAALLERTIKKRGIKRWLDSQAGPDA